MTEAIRVPARETIPTNETWDLTVYFQTLDAWEAGLSSAREALENAMRHKGHLGDSSEHLRQALIDLSDTRLKLEMVVTYAALNRDENTADSERLTRYERAISLALEAGESLAFVQPELLTIDPDRLSSWSQMDDFADYRFMLQDSMRHRPHTRSAEVEEVLAQVRDVERTASDAFDKLTNADLDFGVAADESGNEVELSLGRYQFLLENKNRDVRKNAFETYTAAFQSHINTLAALHAGSVRGDAFSAKARGHASALEASLFSDNIPPLVYTNLIATVRSSSPILTRYVDLVQEILGVDELYAYDLAVPLSPAPRRTFAIDEAVQTVHQGVALLGPDYQSDYLQLIDERMVDWHETEGKRSGAYSWGAWRVRPVVLMNWNGTTDHVFTLAHEVGHAMHFLYANREQPYPTAHYSIFMAEIASTVNEVLLTWELLSQLPPDAAAERFAILNSFAQTIWGTLVRQTMFAEFEMRTHEAVESGVPLTADALSALFAELQGTYVPGVVVDDKVSCHWSRIPHFYNAFYVYQYATGISAAIAMARKIRDEGPVAAERYLAMLSAGGSAFPLDLLARAGVDLTTSRPVEDALAEFDLIVTEMRAIWESGALQQ